MAKIKLVTAERLFIPDVDFPTDEGMINNRDLPEGDQVKCEITMANIEQKSQYAGSYSTIGKKKAGDTKTYMDFHYQKCIEKHCGKVTGLEDFGVTSGITLYKAAGKYPILNEVIQDVFLKVIGAHADDDKEGSDGGEMKEGES